MAEPLLEARGIVKSFGRVQALRGADFTVYPGEVVALIGDNGAGKSTLVKTLSGVHPPDAGEILLRGPARSRSARRDDAARARHRDRLPGSRARAGPRVRGEHVPRPGADAAAACSAGSASSTTARCASAPRRRFATLGVGVQDVERAGRPTCPAASARASPSPAPCTWAQQGGVHGRADGRARRRADAHGARPDPARARARASRSC